MGTSQSSRSRGGKRCLSPSKTLLPLGNNRRPKPRVPLVNGIIVAHAAVAAGTNRNKVVKRRLATLALGNVVTTFIVKHTDFVATPSDTALGFKHVAHVGNPHLFCQSLGDLLLAVRLPRKITEVGIHASITGDTLYTGSPETGSAFHRDFQARLPKGSCDWYIVRNASPPLQSYASPGECPEIPGGSAPETTSKQTQGRRFQSAGTESESLLTQHEKTNRFLSRVENKQHGGQSS